MWPTKTLNLQRCPPVTNESLGTAVANKGQCECAGVLLGTIAIAVLTKYTFPYGWSWTEALLFGAMMAATDPVATVAVLEEVRV